MRTAEIDDGDQPCYQAQPNQGWNSMAEAAAAFDGGVVARHYDSSSTARTF